MSVAYLGGMGISIYNTGKINLQFTCLSCIFQFLKQTNKNGDRCAFIYHACIPSVPLIMKILLNPSFINSLFSVIFRLQGMHVNFLNSQEISLVLEQSVVRF